MELDPLQSLSTDFLGLLSNGEHGMMTDVTFCVEGRQLHAHRCILAARCPFFRLMFSHENMVDINGTNPLSHNVATSIDARKCTLLLTKHLSPPSPLVIPVDVFGFDVFFILLRFLYSGQLVVSEVARDACTSHTACSHSSCSAVVNLLLDLIHAAKIFGVDQLLDLAQEKLGHALEEGVSVQSLLRVLVVAKKQKLHSLWSVCMDLTTSRGLNCDVLRNYLPGEVLVELAVAELQRSGYAIPSSNLQEDNMMCNPCDHHPYHPHEHIISNPATTCNGNLHVHSIHGECCCTEEQKILRLQQALGCMDVELVRLLVIGEGLDLDKAMALHYAVANCNREVVKALLELGYVDVNYTDAFGHTALHLAAEMGNADMIAVLIDHHADPNALTHDGLAAIDIIRGLVKAPNHHGDNALTADHHKSEAATPSPPLCKADQKRILLCIELLQSASAVAGSEEAAESSCITQADNKKGQVITIQAHHELSPRSTVPHSLLMSPPALALAAAVNQEAAVGDFPINHPALIMEDGALTSAADHHHHHCGVSVQNVDYGYLLGSPPFSQHLPNLHCLSESITRENQSLDRKTMSTTSGTTPSI